MCPFTWTAQNPKTFSAANKVVRDITDKLSNLIVKGVVPASASIKYADSNIKPERANNVMDVLQLSSLSVSELLLETNDNKLV